MALFVRRSILIDGSIVTCCLSLVVGALTGQAVAQHPVGHVAGAVGPAPPIFHPPIFHPPIYHAPVYQAPIYQPTYHRPIYAPIIPSRIGAPPVHAFGTVSVRLPGPVRPLPPPYRFIILPVLVSPFWPFNYCLWATCDQAWTSTLIYNGVTTDQWNPPNYVLAPPEPPVYGTDRPDVPQLFLKDGTILNVADYWVIDNQLHFMLVDDGIKPEQQVIPFDELDLQKTVDVNTQRGFRFLLRNEPFEQYVRDHPEGPPPALSPPQQ